MDGQKYYSSSCSENDLVVTRAIYAMFWSNCGLHLWKLFNRCVYPDVLTSSEDESYFENRKRYKQNNVEMYFRHPNIFCFFVWIVVICIVLAIRNDVPYGPISRRRFVDKPRFLCVIWRVLTRYRLRFVWKLVWNASKRVIWRT